MKRPTLDSIALDAFFDNFTCAALFGRLRIPGAPTQIIDPRSFDEFRSEELPQQVERRSESTIEPHEGLWHL